MVDVRQATTEDIAPLATSLAKAFLDDPILSFMTGGKDLPLDKGERFFGHMAKIQLAHDHVYVTGGCEAAAIWTPPDKWKMPTMEVIEATPMLVKVSGVGVRPLQEVTLIEKNHPKEPHYDPRVSRHRPCPSAQGPRCRGVGARAREVRRRGPGCVPRVVEGHERAVLRRFGFETRQVITHKNNGSQMWLVWREPR